MEVEIRQLRAVVAVAEERSFTAAGRRLHLSPHVRGGTSGYLHDPRHRWCWFRDMAPHEVLVFKTHDSDPERAHRVAHTAFTDPTCPPGTPTRASVEIRALALFR